MHLFLLLTWILKIDSEKRIILHVNPGFDVFDLELMFFEHLVAKSFKQFFFVIFIIAGDFYLRTCSIVNFE